MLSDFVRIKNVDSYSIIMKYPLHTVSKPVTGSAAKKLAEAIKSGGFVANEAALALVKRIMARRQERIDAAKQ